MWTGPAPMRPYNSLVHPRSWRAFMEYGNGIVGDMCVHMLDMVRWMLDLGMPTRISSTGGILVDKKSKANITDTQTATFDFPNLQGRLDAPLLRRRARSRSIRGARRSTATRARSRPASTSYDFIPQAKGEAPIHEDVVYELEKFPEDKTEKDLEQHVAPAIRGHMKNFLECIASRGKPVADIEQGYISTAACILANLSHGARPLAPVGSREGRGRRRRGGEQAAAPAVSRAVGASRPGDGLEFRCVSHL